MGNGLSDQRGRICHSPLILGGGGKRVNESRVHGILIISRLVDYMVSFLKPVLPGGVIFVILLRAEGRREIICV
jgi:hypothetical protein